MKIKVQLIIEPENGNEEIVKEIQTWQRDEPLQASNLGLTLAESKQLLLTLQTHLVEEQIQQYQQQHSRCTDCGQKRLHKGTHSLVYRTLFGNLNLKSQRWFHCGCQKQKQKSFSPLAALLPERMAYTLQVHHWNRDPTDNRKENLVALCTSCHLRYHQGGRSNISPGQLSLW